MRPVLFARHRVPPRLLRIPTTSTSASSPSPSLTTKTTTASTALPLLPTAYTTSALSRYHRLRLQPTSTSQQRQTPASRHHSLPVLTCSVHQLPFHASITRTRKDTSTNRHFTSTATRAFSQTTGNNSFSYGDESSHSANMNGTSPATRSKRKEPPQHSSDGRLAKHHRINVDIDMSSADGNTPVTEDFDGPYEDDARHVLPLAPGADTAEWQATVENVIRNVVSIRFCQTCSFDTDPALTSEATGFVVDAERGLAIHFPVEPVILR